MSQETFDVLMLAFGEPGEIRQVDVDIDEKMLPIEILEEIYRLGQNDFQPKQHNSVSMGDVIIMENDDKKKYRFMVCMDGFRKLTDEEFESYNKIPRINRSMAVFDMKSNM